MAPKMERPLIEGLAVRFSHFMTGRTEAQKANIYVWQGRDTKCGQCSGNLDL